MQKIVFLLNFLLFSILGGAQNIRLEGLVVDANDGGLDFRNQ